MHQLMANKHRPLTLNIDTNTIAAIKLLKNRTKSESTSAVIRAAIKRFDFDQPESPAKGSLLLTGAKYKLSFNLANASHQL